ILKLSGDKASIYTVVNLDTNESLFDLFLKENNITHKDEIQNIINRLRVIGHKTGARINFFKVNEGELGDGVCALYDDPKKKLRLYCIRYGNGLIIIGGGGFKTKNIKSFQEDSKLKKENYLLRSLVKAITSKMGDKEIKLVEKGAKDDFQGNLDFELTEQE